MTMFLIQRMDGHLCLDLKSAADHRVYLDKQRTERAASGHDVMYIAVKIQLIKKRTIRFPIL